MGIRLCFERKTHKTFLSEQYLLRNRYRISKRG